MSWKSLVSAGLLCVLASPALAVPTVSATGGGTVSGNFLDATGNWSWQIQVATTNPVPTGSTPLGAELGFRETSTRNIVGAAAKDATVWDTDNPGTQIFTWETLTPSANNKPVGVQTNNATDEVFSALGSIDIATTAAQNYIKFGVQRPQTSAAGTLSTTTVQLLGAYTGKGRIAELTGPSTSVNYSAYAGSVSFNAKAGDANLDGTISNADYSTLLANYNQNNGTRQWNHADFNGDTNVTNADYSMLLANYGAANNYAVQTGGFTNAGAGSGGAVPEPATIALVGLALLGGLGVVRRKR